MKVLIIGASPLAKRSVSNQMASVFEQAYTSANPEDEVGVVDLSSLEFPCVTEDLVNYFNGDSPELADQYSFLDDLCKEFVEADKYVFAVPHWNLILPPNMIHYSLAVMRAGTCFAYTEAGPVGLLNNKKALVLVASGGTCNTNNPIMHCYGIDWLKGILGLCGVNDFLEIYAQGMKEQPDAAQTIIGAACTKVEALAKKW